MNKIIKGIDCVVNFILAFKEIATVITVATASAWFAVEIVKAFIGG